MEFILKQNQCLDVPIEEIHAKEVLEVENLKKALQLYKVQNAHLNDVNDKLIQSNQRLREDLEKINTNYAELDKAAEEVVRRRKLA